MIRGVGVGLRSQHYAHILKHSPPVPWFEVVTDNYLDHYGPPLLKLQRIRESYPMVMHGVGLSIGSCDPLNLNYLDRVKALAERIEPAWISDHFCWTSYKSRYSHELLPLPYTEDTIKHLVSRIQLVQDYFKRPLILENISSYLSFTLSQMHEADFINAVAKRSGCQILLDINNIYVNSQNHGFDATKYLLSIDKNAVNQFHLAGYEKKQHLLIDTHGTAVYPEVWSLFELAIQRFGCLPSCIEWDNHVPDWEELMAETKKAAAIMNLTTPMGALCN